MDCTSKLVQSLFEKILRCARLKTEEIVKNVMLPFAQNNLKEKLDNITGASIYSDASNHKDVRIFPTLIRYFDHECGIQTKVLDLVSYSGETSEMYAKSLIFYDKKKFI